MLGTVASAYQAASAVPMLYALRHKSAPPVSLGDSSKNIHHCIHVSITVMLPSMEKQPTESLPHSCLSLPSQ